MFMMNLMFSLTKHVLKLLKDLFRISYFLCKAYKKIIQQEAINVLTENNFLQGKNVFAYQKHKNSSQALLPPIVQRPDAISSGKYGITVMADLKEHLILSGGKVPFKNCMSQE